MKYPACRKPRMGRAPVDAQGHSRHPVCGHETATYSPPLAHRTQPWLVHRIQVSRLDSTPIAMPATGSHGVSSSSVPNIQECSEHFFYFFSHPPVEGYVYILIRIYNYIHTYPPTRARTKVSKCSEHFLLLYFVLCRYDKSVRNTPLTPRLSKTSVTAVSRKWEDAPR